MGTFAVQVEVGALSNTNSVTVEALVDTGATHSVFPSNVLRRLGLEPVDTKKFSLADERKVELGIGQARLRIGKQEWIVLVIFGPDDAEPIIGATTLETFGFAADPVGKQLVPVDGLLKYFSIQCAR